MQKLKTVLRDGDALLMFKTITTGLVITEEDLIKFVPGYDAEYG